MYDNYLVEGVAAGVVNVYVKPTLTPNVSGVLFVNKDVLISGNGSSWDNAVKELADALTYIESCDASSIKEIWVAKQTYYPMYIPTNLIYTKAGNTFIDESERDKAFLLPNNVAIYGGFNGNELTLEERNWKENPTILSGDLGEDLDPSNNCYHVLVAGGLTNTRLDGFIIQDANADKEGIAYLKPGMFFYQNEGGAIYEKESSVIYSNLIIKDNQAQKGAGIYSLACNSKFANSLIYNNQASYQGGGLLADGTHSYFINTTFADNISGLYGSEIAHIAGSAISLQNSIVWEQSPSNSIIDLNSAVPIVNSSIVQDYNSSTDPLFVDPSSGNYELQLQSPAINIGDSTYYKIGNYFKNLDLAVNTRITGNNIELGPYEIPCNPNLLAQFLTPDTSACFGESAMLRVSITDDASPRTIVYTTYDGQNTDTITISNIVTNEYELIISPFVETTYKLISIANSYGCKVNLEDSIKVSVTQVQNSGDVQDSSVCLKQSLVLGDILGLPAIWTSLNPEIAEVDPKTGEVATISTGIAVISYQIIENDCLSLPATLQVLVRTNALPVIYIGIKK